MPITGCSVVSGWIRNMMLYRNPEDFKIGVSVDMGAMTDINRTKYGWSVFYPDINAAVEALKSAYSTLNEGDWEVFEGPTSYLVNVKRKNDWYDLAIFKVLKTQIAAPQAASASATICS
jgi:hypothetical protein